MPALAGSSFPAVELEREAPQIRVPRRALEALVDDSFLLLLTNSVRQLITNWRNKTRRANRIHTATVRSVPKLLQVRVSGIFGICDSAQSLSQKSRRSGLGVRADRINRARRPISSSRVSNRTTQQPNPNLYRLRRANLNLL